MIFDNNCISLIYYQVADFKEGNNALLVTDMTNYMEELANKNTLLSVMIESCVVVLLPVLFTLCQSVVVQELVILEYISLLTYIKKRKKKRTKLNF